MDFLVYPVHLLTAHPFAYLAVALLLTLALAISSKGPNNKFKRLLYVVLFLSIPLTAVILTGILFKLYVPGGIETYPAGALMVCAGTILIYGIAAWFENKKHFIKPLNRFRSILEDMEHPA